MSYKTIKQLTELTGITEGALRYYHKKNVVSPSLRKTDGRREWLYDDDAIKRLCMVRLLTFVGIPVDKVREMLTGDEGYCRALLKQQIETIRQEIKREQCKISLVEALLNQGAQTDLIDAGWLLAELSRLDLEKEEIEE